MMKKWAENLIETHRNPIVKLKVTHSKLFVARATSDEKALITANLNILSDTIKLERVERRCARSKAIWLTEQKLAQIIKPVGTQSYGFQNKNGYFLYPEEALFLLETNRLEIIWQRVPISIQQGYDIILNDKIKLVYYEAYKKLAQQGYKIVRPEHLTKSIKPKSFKLHTDMFPFSPRKKLKLLSNQHTDIKISKTKKLSMELIDHGNSLSDCPTESLLNNKQCIHLKECTKSTSETKHTSIIHHMFERLMDDGPRNFEGKFHEQETYKIYSPKQSSKICPDINIYIVNDDELPPRLGSLQEEVPNVFGIVTPASVAYYRFSSVTLPTLW